MDFGLAQMATASALTKAGPTLGTIAYMSPVQSRGEKVYLIRGAGPRLFLKRAGNFEVTELAGTLNARAPFFSPGGRWIGYLNQQTSEIYKILVDGGEPLKVVSKVPREASATWALDNTNRS